MAGFAEIRFKGTRKEYFTFRGMEVHPGTHVVVEADRGEDLGEVTALGTIAERKCGSSGGGSFSGGFSGGGGATGSW